MEEAKHDCQSPSDWGSMLDLTSWGLNDPKKVSDLRIVLLGKNVSENSRVGNIILGTAAFHSEASSSYLQQHSVIISVTVEKRHVTVINTPPLLQPQLTQHQITQRVRECVSLSAPGPHVILLVLQFKDFSEEDLRRVRTVLNLFSVKAIKHTIVLTTDGETRTYMIYKTVNNAIQNLIKECGGRHLQFDARNRSEMFRWIEMILREEHEEFLVCKTHDDGGDSVDDPDNSDLKGGGKLSLITKTGGDGGVTTSGKAKLNIVLCGYNTTHNNSVSKIFRGKPCKSQKERSKVCVKKEGKINGRQITVIQLPALTRLSEEEVMRETLRCLILCDPGVHHFILVTPVGSLTNEDKAEMEKIKRIFNSNEHFMVLFITELTVDQSMSDLVSSTESQSVWSLYGSWYCVMGLKDDRNSGQISKILDYIENMKTEPYSLQMYMSAPEKRVRDEQEEKLSVRDNEIKELQEKIKTLDPEGVKLNLVLCGSNRRLKSFISNLILNQGDRRSELSSGCVRRDVELHGRLVSLVELPALFNTRISEEEVMRQTLRCVSLCDPGVHVFLLIIPDAPLNNEDRAEMENIQRIFSSRINKHTMILINQNPEDRTAELNEETQSVIESFGGRHHCIGPDTQVSMLMEKLEKMVEANNGVCFSTETLMDAQMEKLQTFEKMKRRTTWFQSQDSKEREDEVRIVLLGKTGVGKSATGNTILGREAFISDTSQKSITKVCKKETAEIYDRHVTVIDTPGLFDTELTNEEIQREISNCISMILPGPHVFLLLIPVGRFTQEEATSVKIIQETFGENSLKYTMVLFTRGDDLKKKTIEEWLRNPEPALKNLIEACGNRYHVFNNNQTGDRTQVSDLLQKIDDMVKANGDSYYSCKMFREMERGIQEQQKKIQTERVEQLNREKEELMNKHEEEKKRMKMTMEEERQNHYKERKTREEEFRKREEQYKRDIKEREDKERNMREEMKRKREEWERQKQQERQRSDEEDERRRKKEKVMRDEYNQEKERWKMMMEEERQYQDKERKRREEKEERRRKIDKETWDEYYEKLKRERERRQREKEDLQFIHEEEMKREMKRVKMKKEEERQNQDEERKRREEKSIEREEQYRRDMKDIEDQERKMREEMKREREEWNKQKQQERRRRHETHNTDTHPQGQNYKYAYDEDSPADPGCLRILLFGRKGNGKSATGNTILGNNQFHSESSSDSVTTTCQKGDVEVDGKSVAVVDTPGLFDTSLTKEQVVEEMMKCVSLSAPGPHVFIIVLSVGRITQEDEDTLDMIKMIFGPKAAKFSIVLFTKGDELKKQTIKQYVEKNDELKKLIRECGNRFLAFNSRETQDRTQVTELMNMIEEVKTSNDGRYFTNEMFEEAAISIQKRGEMLEENKRKNQAQVEELKARYETEVNSMRQRLEEKKQKIDEERERLENKFREQEETLWTEFEEKEKSEEMKQEEEEDRERSEEEEQRRAEYDQTRDEMEREIENYRLQCKKQLKEREEEDRMREEKYKQDQEKMKTEQEHIMAELRREQEEEIKKRDLEEQMKKEREEEEREEWKRKIKEAEDDEEIQEDIKRQQREWEEEKKRQMREREEEERERKERHEEQLREKQEELEKMRKIFEAEREEEEQMIEEEKQKLRREREQIEKEYKDKKTEMKRRYEQLEGERKEEWKRRKREDEERRGEMRKRWEKMMEDLKREQEEEIERREREEREIIEREEKECEEMKQKNKEEIEKMKKKHQDEARKQEKELKDFIERKEQQGLGPAAAEARRRSQTWGSKMDLSVDVETGSALSQHPSDRSSASHQGVEARAAVSSPPMEAPILQLSSSEELDVVSVEAESEDSPPQSHAFEELLDVVTRAVHRLSIEWPEDRQDVRSKSKLDERFLPSRTQPQRRSLPFFPDLHTEVSRSWGKPVSYRVYAPQTSHYSSIQKNKECGYGEMPKVEETLASYLSPATASSLKAPSLPSKPVKYTSSLVHKSYAAAGQAAACLHTMSIMQAYQAELLGDLEEGGGIGPDTVAELRRATDLSLRATKETAKSIGRSMAALVATERHLWLNLSDIKEKEKHVLLDAPVSTAGLFGDAVNSAVAKSQEAAKQAAALQKLLPRRSFYEAAEREQPHSSKKSAEHRATQKQSVSSRAPPQKPRGHGGRSQTQQSSRGDRSANPATSGVTGRSGLRRAHISRSTRKRSGLGMPAPSEEGARAVCSVVPCRCAVTGSRTDYSTATKSRNQSREAGTSSRIFDSVEATVKCFSLGPADRGKRVSDTIQETPTSVYGGPAHSGGPRAGSGYGTGSKHSVGEGGHRICTPLQQGNRVLQPVLHSSKKGRGIASHSRSSSSERVSHAAQVQNVNFETNRATDQVRGLVSIFPYFHISIRPCHWKFLRFAFGGKAYQYRVLPFGLALSPRTFTKCVDAALAPLRLQGIRIMNYIDDWLILAQSHQLAVQHRDVVLAHMKELGLRLNAKKSVLSPLQRTTFLGVVWDSVSMQARLSPPRIDSILAAVKSVKLGQLLTVKQFQRLLGLMAAASNVIPFGLLHMRPLQWWLRTRGFSPRGNPFRTIKVTRRCLRALVMWKKPWFLSQGPVLGAPCRRKLLTTDASLTGWGAILEGRSAQGLWEDHHRSWHINRLEMLAVFRALRSFITDLRGHLVLVHTDNTSVVAYINHQGGLRSRPLSNLARHILLWSQGKLLSLRAAYIPGVQNIGADTLSRQGPRPGEWRLHPEVVELIWREFGQAQVDLFASRETSHCPLWFSLTHPAPLGLDAMGPGLPASDSPALAGQSMVSRSCVPPRRASSGVTCQEGPSVPSRGLNISPPPRTVEPVGLASEGAQLIESGLSTEVVETILQSRAPSTRKLYALKWRVFTSWCSDRRLDPVHCPIGTVLEFLQERFTAGLTPSTLKVYVAAIGAYHIPLGGMSVGKDPLVSRFLRGTWRLRPAVRSRVPPWDLSVALQGLSQAPFEPIEEVPEKFLTLKALFLLAISSLKRIGDLQALSVAPSCLEFAPGMVKAFLHPRPGYIPKVPTNVVRPVVLQAFCPPPFQNADQEANNLLCPVRALDAYVHRAALWRKSDQLFVCFGSPNKGGPVSKQRMSKWVVEAISLAYEAAGQPSPLAVRSHSTRSMAASKALISGVSLQDVCDAAGWSSRHTFVRFYSLDLDSAPGSHVLSS
ncbi:unnamed protein product [Leuciscus chuanchicus]